MPTSAESGRGPAPGGRSWWRCTPCSPSPPGSRSAVQLVTKGDEAPLAYALSLAAALVYVVATLALRRTTPRAHRVAVAAVGVELVGVLVVGTLTVVDGELFPDQTVWSTFGIGYGFVPLVLPFVGLWWLLSSTRRAQVIVIPPSTGSTWPVM